LTDDEWEVLDRFWRSNFQIDLPRKAKTLRDLHAAVPRVQASELRTSVYELMEDRSSDLGLTAQGSSEGRLEDFVREAKAEAKKRIVDSYTKPRLLRRRADQ
jgi:hypothetical protein